MTTPGFRKRLLDADKLITTDWLKPKPKPRKTPIWPGKKEDLLIKPDQHPFKKMNPRPLKAAEAAKLKADFEAKRTPGPRTVLNKIQQLMARDGINCWLCHEPLGTDISLEHLCPTSVGGPNHMHNYVLTHKACNRRLDNKPVAEKVRMREVKL